jgi:GPH family glycoside/pentoside/hexuronide:cation symporter
LAHPTTISSPGVSSQAQGFDLKYRLTWGVAALGTQMSLGVYGALLPIFYQDYLGLAARWIALASVVYAVWNAINDPIIGYISDNTRFKQGRRIPYMRYTAPMLALAFSLIWFPPRRAGELAILGWMMATMVLYDAAYTIIGLVYAALLPEVTESDAERNGLQISASLFGMAGLVIGILISELYRPKGESLSTLQIAMAIVGLLSMACVILTSLRVKERPEFRELEQRLSLRDSLRFTLTSKSFLVMVTQTFMSTLGSALVIGSLFYLADYVVQVNSLVLLLFIVIPLVVGIVATSSIRARIGVVGALQILLLIAGAGLLLVTIMPAPWIPLGLALAGFGLAGPQTLTNVLYGQIVDEDELRSGVRREGAFFGVNALLTKPAQSIALATLPAVLELARFVPRGENLGQLFPDQPESALWGIRSLTGLIPGLALILGAVVMIWYPLRGRYLAQMKKELGALHATKRAEWEKSR